MKKISQPWKQVWRNKLKAIMYILRGHGVMYRMHYDNGATVLDPKHPIVMYENSFTGPEYHIERLTRNS